MLVAGIGNIFLADDGFGVEVARRLDARKLPGSVRVADFGIRGVHLAYELLDHPYETTILVDATPRGGKPGTVYLIEPEIDASAPAATPDAHGMNPEAVLEFLKVIGGTPGRFFIVGCEPACLEEGIGLSAPVEGAVEQAITLIQEIIERQALDVSPPTPDECKT